MKKGYFLWIIAACFVFNLQQANAQIDSNRLDVNNISATFSAFSTMFNFGKYIVPKASNPPTGTIFAAGLWMGGIDNFGQLRVAAQTYRQNGTDFLPGTLDASGNPFDSVDYDYIWRVQATTIDSFLTIFSQNGGTLTPSQVPASIWGWPGKGNTHATGSAGTFAVSDTEDMAPFFDRNFNGIYDPEHGDYPLIKGDEALWWVFNDNDSAHTESGGLPLKFEIQATAYAHASTDTVINNTIYLSFHIVNHSDRTYDSLFTSAWFDMDIGCGENDYVGCDTVLNYFYGYNGTLTDPTCVGETGYGSCPPVQTVQFLTQPMANFIRYNNDFSVQGNPTSPRDYYNYMMARWKDDSYLTKDSCSGYGGKANTNYMFPGNPALATIQPFPASWSESSCANPPGHVRGMGGISTMQLQPGGYYNMDLALTTFLCAGADTNFNTNNIASGIVEVQQQYTSDMTLGIEDIKTSSGIAVYPNPSSGNFTISITGNTEPGATLFIYDMLGREVYRTYQTNRNINVSLNQSGVYIIRYNNGDNSVTKKVVVQ